MKPPTLFDYLKAVNESGGRPDMLESEEALKAYSPFMINRGVAQSMDTVMFAQALNKAGVTDKEMHYAFLFRGIKKKKRFAKWAKKEDSNEDLLLIQEIYQVNQERAASYLELLDAEQIASLRQHQDRGGRVGRSNK